jgi:N-methylhydantoinase A/oxoprolinase/acetone carboxylase beta subunit
VARGLDPAELALVAAGGAGPLLACGIAETLELAEVIVPPRPGLLAAWGLLVAPDRREASATVLRPLSSVSPEQSAAYYQHAWESLSQAPPQNARTLSTAALRYLGQGFEVEVNVDHPADIAEIESRFHDAHEQEYGFAMRGAPVEWVELRVAWELPAPEWQFPGQASQGGQPDRALVWESPPGSPGGGKQSPVAVQAAIYTRDELSPETRLPGPAVVMEKDATTYIPTGWVAQVTAGGYLRINKHER